jgi:acyl dehydratase
MCKILFFDDLKVDDQWISPARQVTEADVHQFAHLTGDFDPLHVDKEFAKETPFRQPIAHGLLGLSLVAGIGSESPNVETVAFLGVSDWSFRRPIYFGDTLHVWTTITDLQPNGRRRGQVTWHRKLMNQDDFIVQEGSFLSLVACQAASLHVTLPRQQDLASAPR